MGLLMLSGTGPQLSSLRTEIRPGNVRFPPVSEELREVLLALWKKQKFPVGGYILAAPSGKPVPVILDNLAKLRFAGASSS
jgi:hypothetical protein